ISPRGGSRTPRRLPALRAVHPMDETIVSDAGGGGESAPRTVHFVSLGCPKNRVDGEVMLGGALQKGYRHVDDAGDAEVIVVNTCGFIESAKKESIETI